ncbi:MAG: 3-deoxy-D-manno-octulosonic acid transferase, partial [Nitrospirae bacterium]
MAVLRFFLLIYQVIYTVALLFLLPRELLRCPRGQRLRWLKERFGFITPTHSPEKKNLWIHAVSVGETLAARPLLDPLNERFNLYLSTVTHTGQE